jgi:hypothetical protein
MNRRALRPELLLKFCNGKIHSAMQNSRKTGIPARDPFDFLKIIEVIGRDEEPSIFNQRLADRA